MKDGTNNDLIGDLNNQDIIRDMGNMSKQSLPMMGSISSRRDKQSVIGDNTTTARKQANSKKVIMHVNQFVPFFMQYHSLSATCLGEFSKDYSTKENALFKN